MPTLLSTARKLDRGLFLVYAAIWALVWTVQVIASLQNDVERGLWRPYAAAFQATWTLGPAILVGIIALPLSQWSRHRAFSKVLGVHLLGALIFCFAWQALSFAAGWFFYGMDYAEATFKQTVLWRIIWGCLMYLGLNIGFSSILNAREARQNAMKAAQAEIARSKAEYSALRGKLNPHFLFNTLNTLVALTRIDPQQAEENLLRFSNLLRQLLDQQRHDQDVTSIAEEIAFVKEYVAIEKLRMGSRLNINWLIAPESESIEIPVLSLQPLIENAIIHGLAPQIHGGTLTIKVQQLEDGRTQIDVSDDGVGSDPQTQASKRAGLGIAAVRRRFELMFPRGFEMRQSTALGKGFSSTLIFRP